MELIQSSYVLMNQRPQNSLSFHMSLSPLYPHLEDQESKHYGCKYHICQEALVLTVPGLVIELARCIFEAIAPRWWGRQGWVCCEDRKNVWARSSIDFLGLEGSLELVFVEISKQGQRWHEVWIFGPKSRNHGHASELIIECGNVEWWAAEILDSKHGPLNLSS